VTSEESLDAGKFSPWLTSILGALDGGHGSDVPCGTCTACCTSSQFVHIEPDEQETLAHIPDEVLFPAPKLPQGHLVMGYDENGHCPMLIGGRCSIYAYRPRTCRVYDCRVFAASGLGIGDSGKDLIASRVSRWEFQFPSEEDRMDYESVRAAAGYLRDHAAEIGGGTAAMSPAQHSLLAVQLHGLFLDGTGDAGESSVTTPEINAVRVELRRRAG